MKYVFSLVLLLTGWQAQAQIGLIMGVRAATSAATIVANSKKAKAAGGSTMALAPNATTPVTPFEYRGQTVSRQRTAPASLTGKGAEEILALEAALEQTHAALLADSVASFLPAAQLETIAAAARQAARARANWNYLPYQQELAFYQQEETRRQKAATEAGK